MDEYTLPLFLDQTIGYYPGDENNWEGWQAALILSKRQNAKPQNPPNDYDTTFPDKGIGHIEKKAKLTSRECMDSDGSNPFVPWPNHETQFIPEVEAYKAESDQIWYNTDAERRRTTGNVVACAIELVKSDIDPDYFTKIPEDEVFRSIIKLVLSVLDLDDIGNIFESEKHNSIYRQLLKKINGYFKEDSNLSPPEVATMSQSEIYDLIVKKREKAMDLIADEAFVPEDFAELDEKDVQDLIWCYVGSTISEDSVSPMLSTYLLPFKGEDTKQVFEEMNSFVPLKVDYKMQFNLELSRRHECHPLLDYLFVEACKGFITNESFEALKIKLKGSSAVAERVLSRFLKQVHRGIHNFFVFKARMLDIYENVLLYPLESGFFGEFAPEVIDVVMAADHERRILGHRFIGVDVILRGLLVSRVCNHYLVKSAMSSSSHDKPAEMPPYRIYKLAGVCAKHFGDEKVQLEHLVLAVISVKYGETDILTNETHLKSLREEDADLNANLKREELKYDWQQPIADYVTLIRAIIKDGGLKLPDMRSSSEHPQ